MTRLELMAGNLKPFLTTCSLVEIEAILRACAVELSDRAMPDTGKLFDVARSLERFRLGLRPAEKSK